MIGTATNYAAELEQALAASDREDRSIKSGCSFYAAQDDVIERYGVGGDDLLHDYQNALYELEIGHPAAYVLFH